MLSSKSMVRPFRNRRDAEKALAEIIESGGRIQDYQIDQDPSDGRCVITVFEDNSRQVAGTLGA